MKHVGLLALLFYIASVVGATQSPRVILAVFAHPDDETFVLLRKGFSCNDSPTDMGSRISRKTLRNILIE